MRTLHDNRQQPGPYGENLTPNTRRRGGATTSARRTSRQRPITQVPKSKAKNRARSPVFCSSATTAGATGSLGTQAALPPALPHRLFTYGFGCCCRCLIWRHHHPLDLRFARSRFGNAPAWSCTHYCIRLSADLRLRISRRLACRRLIHRQPCFGDRGVGSFRVRVDAGWTSEIVHEVFCHMRPDWVAVCIFSAGLFARCFDQFRLTHGF